jgi:hypothetical protein
MAKYVSLEAGGVCIAVEATIFTVIHFQSKLKWRQTSVVRNLQDHAGWRK